MAKRLTEKHPLLKKLRDLENFMDENKISVEWDGYRMIIRDNESGIEAEYKDKESGEFCQEIPYLTETKLIIED